MNSCRGQIVKTKLSINDELCKLVLRLHSVLQFVELAEAISTIQEFQDVVNDILCCIARCIMFISNVGNTRPGLRVLLTNGNLRIEKLHDELRTLESRMTQSMALEAVRTSSDIRKKVDVVYESQQFSKLNPLPMQNELAISCFPGTRSKVMAELAQWALLPSSNMGNILWMHAHAGSGKSTIARTLATLFEGLGCLGGFVFFNRDVEERSTPRGMVRTLAYQLASRREEFAPAISACIEESPWIIDTTLEIQFQKLLVEPLIGTLPLDGRPVVIIIDALDEGGTHAQFLSVLSREAPKLPSHVRIMITSRKDLKIEQAFEHTAGLNIYELDQSADIDYDIRTYIVAQMHDIHRAYATELPAEWPAPKAVDALVRQANGLFIWANVACAYIQECMPDLQIQNLLAGPASRAEAEHSLNDLYEIAILNSGNWKIRVFSETMQKILAMIVVSQNPQTASSIGDLTGIQASVVTGFVSRLRSVLNTDQHGYIKVVHPSLHDYLVNPKRCHPNRPWFVSQEKEHALMTSRCIKVLETGLKRNIMSMETPATQPFSFPTSLSDSIIYASTAWTYHLCRVTDVAETPALANMIDQFLSKHFLHWIEVLSILKQSRNSITWLQELRDWYAQLNLTCNNSFKIMLYDFWRFVKAFSRTLETHPLLVYETALTFCPKRTTISPTFPSPDIRVISASLETWSPCMMILSGHPYYVDYVSISSSGDLIATGSIDGCLNIWSASLGTRPFSYLGGGDKTSGLIAVVFASNGHHIMSGQMAGEICFWDVFTGGLLKQFRVRNGEELTAGKTDLVCVQMANDDCTIACGFRDGMVQIWNTLEQPTIPLLSGHRGIVHDVAFSRSQDKVASSSADSTIRLWNARTGAHINTLLGHGSGINNVAFFPNDECELKLASVSADRTLKIWDGLTGLTIWDVAARTINLGPLTSPKRRATALSLSHDGTQVAALYTFREFKFGLEFIIRDTANGKVILEKKIETEVEALTLESFRVCYTADDKYLIIQYGQLEPGIVAKRAFHRSSGEECLEGRISECHSLLAIQTQIIGPFFLQLPMDGNWMARILCWDSTEDKIVIGTYSGDVYFVAFAR
ncbi:hypothetical protein C8J57DRAFT_1581954 [Mycena rebaudengoi]|nr:hypothetical protein C8J57DRAFT_1581954 [Mycena rebaudengoi]